MWIQDVRNNLSETDAKAGNAMDRTMESGQTERDLGNAQVGLADASVASNQPYMTSGLQSQDRVTNNAENRGKLVFDTYSNSYVPLNEKVSSDAMNFDSPDQLERAAQTAGADVTKSFDNQAGITQRNLERAGVNPGSGRYVRNTQNLGLQEAAARAGAETNARDTRRLQAVQLRQQGAQQGNAILSGANQADQLALAGGQGLVSSADKATMTPLNARATAVPFFNSSNTAFNNSGTLANTNRDASVKAMTDLSGDLMNMGGSAIGAISSKDAKTDKEPIDGDRVLEGLESIPVEKWKYKDGVADEGRHVGPYAEDVHKQFGDRAAPGGKMIDPISMIGLTLAAVKALAKKVDQQGNKMRRPTEPRARQSEDYARAGSGGEDAYDRGSRGSSGVMEKTFGLQPVEVSSEGAY